IVSSKWTAGESPSPFQLTAALMPPCAQTECERLTGTTEKRSTVPPPSQILIVVMSPARPPPTTRCRCSATRRRSTHRQTPPLSHGSSPRSSERRKDRHRAEREHREEREREPPHERLRALAHGEPPGDAEREDAVAEVEHRRQDAEQVEREPPRIGEDRVHQRVVDLRVVEVEREPQRVDVPGDEDEGDDAADPLQHVEEAVAIGEVRRGAEVGARHHDEAV